MKIPNRLKMIGFSFALCGYTNSIHAQNFSFTAESSIDGSNSAYELVAKGNITNQGADSLFRWVRTKKVLSNGWESSVCDTNSCYFPQVDSADVTIPGGTSTKLNIYFYPDGKEGTGFVEVKVFAIANPLSFKIGKFMATAKPTSILNNEESYQRLTTYPNPARQHIIIEHPFSKGSIMVYDTNGRFILNQPISGKQSTIKHLKAGTYKIIAISENHERYFSRCTFLSE